MENLKQLIENVRLMRRWQKEYFKTRSAEALRWSKDLERRVDAMDGNMAMDYKLMDIPYDIVYGRKTEADYENKDIIEQNANKENAL